MKKELKYYFPIAKAIAALFYPHVEVVIHDLQTGRIAAIFNPFSKRNVGDESLLSDLVTNLSELPETFPPYSKTNWDGRKMKSTTATLKNQDHVPIGLFCINFDISQWEGIHQLLSEWIKLPVSIEKPDLLFENDWRERINAFVSSYLQKQEISMAALAKDRVRKKELVHMLHEVGAFKAKNAAAYVAEVLGLSRATIYNYLGLKNG